MRSSAQAKSSGSSSAAYSGWSISSRVQNGVCRAAHATSSPASVRQRAAFPGSSSAQEFKRQGRSVVCRCEVRQARARFCMAGKSAGPVKGGRKNFMVASLNMVWGWKALGRQRGWGEVGEEGCFENGLQQKFRSGCRFSVRNDRIASAVLRWAPIAFKGRVYFGHDRNFRNFWRDV